MRERGAGDTWGEVDSLSSGKLLRKPILVSRSRHSDVYRLTMSSEGLQGEKAYSLKVLHAEENRLRHQAVTLRRLSCASARTFADFPLPPVVSMGRAPAGLRRDARTALYVVAPWVEGVTLASLLKGAVRSGRPPTLDGALALLRSVAANVAALGQLKGAVPLVHGDIKPANVVVSVSGGLRTVLIDTDTAFFLDDAQSFAPIGTFGYAAPETILQGWDRRTTTVTEAADVFSFGVVAHEVLSGRWPYPFKPGCPSSLRFWRDCLSRIGGLTVDQAVPRDMRMLIAACLAFDPTRRPSAAEVLECVERSMSVHCGSGETCRAPRSEGPVFATVLGFE